MDFVSYWSVTLPQTHLAIPTVAVGAPDLDMLIG